MFPDRRYVFLSVLFMVVVLAVNTLVFGRAASDIDIVKVFLVPYAITAAIVGLAKLQKRAPRVHDGWQYLTPSAAEWCAVLGCFAMTLLFLYVFHFVGSARADAESQMIALKCLIAGFAFLTVAGFIFSFGSRVRWNDQCIEQYPLFLPRRTIRWAEVAWGGESWTGRAWLAASDGTVVRFSPGQNGAEALFRTISGSNPSENTA
jgi:hypothetical protein